MKELENKIRESLPHLQVIEKGQLFHSKYYGNITATKVTRHGGEAYSIYGFCEEGLPRDCYYPKELELVGKPIMLNDVLLWHSTNGRDLYSHFEVNMGQGVFRVYDSEESYSIIWDLEHPFLTDQSEELIEFLNGIDYER
ncbi:MAG TPA: hypothetical protein VLA48_03570 [Nitrososphaeraceae archaeon]|nr:hypothetical protein [Nitrososphaeraceae archaeon]